MSKLEELIEQLCSDGVEYKTLGDVATISRGGNFQKRRTLQNKKPCIHYGQIYTRYGLFTDKTLTFINDECFCKNKNAEPNDIIMAVTSENIEDICKCVAWLGTEKVAVSGHSAIIHHSLNPKYLAYFFISQHFFNQKIGAWNKSYGSYTGYFKVFSSLYLLWRYNVRLSVFWTISRS